MKYLDLYGRDACLKAFKLFEAGRSVEGVALSGIRGVRTYDDAVHAIKAGKALQAKHDAVEIQQAAKSLRKSGTL